ncbi:MAG: T9SS type A sorting domain-containing protein [Ignavibacteria bacterium]|nr:T9SS type A sorting domain-containing protein [Ignavibacteria bacterium]
MKKLILLQLALLFFATTFSSNPPPGWYQQPLPFYDLINDVFFLDSLNGWIITDGNNNTGDTGFILRTNNGGNNWTVQYSRTQKLSKIQFLDSMTGYTAGGSGGGTGRIYKTTDGGNNWVNIATFGSRFTDLFFINKDTGWACDPIGFGAGLVKTTDGGFNWIQQLSQSYRPEVIFFISKDTGWTSTENADIYRTNNGGSNWSLLNTFFSGISDISFVGNDTGWASSQTTYKTTNSGITWNPTQTSGIKIQFLNNILGYACSNFGIIRKTTNGGLSWYRQNAPNSNYGSIIFLDSIMGWAGGNQLVHTTDGGGPITSVSNNSNNISDMFILHQNYPNPFNPVTVISYSLKENSLTTLKVFDVLGREVTTLVNENQNAGSHSIEFNADDYTLSSGIYFYSLFANNNLVATKSMLLIK